MSAIRPRLILRPMVIEPTAVEAYSSYAYAVEPRAFTLRGERHRVQSVLRTWRTPGWVHFFVQDDRENALELRYDEQQDTWWLEVNNPGD